MSWSRQQIRTGGWPRGARFVDERAYTGALEDLATCRDELKRVRELLQLARSACDDAECFVAGFEDDEAQSDVLECLRKLRAVAAAEEAEGKPA